MKEETNLKGKRVGLVMTGSFCTFQKVFDQLEPLKPVSYTHLDVYKRQG